ncbi:DNA-binding NarL/FixJ family response regulator [Acetoanaerobium pronyense]|uniref:Stage 0 sporulation protein A homolog n=1 Tax=Acetoanaerobium pronyense TaxID=1482736 RepID=A0ABS4KQT9_9FIRM|nr:response regulator [Acetoanaerobium pronyense]MBP2028969.1 DNA-binding NarL/FixJ family response regulator [Acetoanaerobium pronyense]
MDKAKFMIVDDSPFSIAVIKSILEDNGYDVVSTATNKTEMLQNVIDSKPNFVTMDMTLPGTNGLECTELLRDIDKNIKVIIISSLKDKELLKNAYALKVSGYIQKPIDEEELLNIIKKLIDSDKIYEELQNTQFNIFKEAFADGINKMTKTIVTFGEDSKNSKSEASRGVSCVIGIIGSFPGRLIIDMSMETASKITDTIFNRENKGMDEIINVVSELTNIIAGNGCSVLNRKNSVLGLRLSPPTIFYGNSLHISQTGSDSYTTKIFSEFGEMTLYVGFSKSDKQLIQTNPYF